jgi:hypothetical protein
MAQRKGLGKGLDALIPGGKSTSSAPSGFVSSGSSGVQQVAVKMILTNWPHRSVNMA